MYMYIRPIVKSYDLLLPSGFHCMTSTLVPRTLSRLPNNMTNPNKSKLPRFKSCFAAVYVIFSMSI